MKLDWSSSADHNDEIRALRHRVCTTYTPPFWVGQFLITDSQTPAAVYGLQRASHHGHLTDPDKEPTAAIVDFSRLTYEDALA